MPDCLARGGKSEPAECPVSGDGSRPERGLRICADVLVTSRKEVGDSAVGVEEKFGGDGSPVNRAPIWPVT